MSTSPSRNIEYIEYIDYDSIHPLLALDRIEQVLTAIVAAIHQEGNQKQCYCLVNKRHRSVW